MTFWRKKRKANKESGDGSGELADLVNNISAKSGKPIHPTATRTHADADAHMRAWLIRLYVLRCRCLQECECGRGNPTGSNQNMPDRLLVAAINCYLGLQNDELLYMHDDEMLLLVNKNYPT